MLTCPFFPLFGLPPSTGTAALQKQEAFHSDFQATPTRKALGTAFFCSSASGRKLGFAWCAPWKLVLVKPRRACSGVEKGELRVNGAQGSEWSQAAMKGWPDLVSSVAAARTADNGGAHGAPKPLWAEAGAWFCPLNKMAALGTAGYLFARTDRHCVGQSWSRNMVAVTHADMLVNGKARSGQWHVAA